MKNKIISLSDCKKACLVYNPEIEYVNVHNSITFWLQKKQAKKQKVNSKIKNSGGKI